MTRERLEEQVRFLLEADKLKEVGRQTLCTQSRRPENSAEHSWHLALAAIVLAEHADERVDLLRVIQMVVLHDLVEIDAGDTFAYDAQARKTQHEREARAADRIFGLLPADQAGRLRALWDEFEEGRTAEARFAAALDRFQPVLQNCSTEGASWRRHGVTVDRVLGRNRTIGAGSAALWAKAEAMIRGAERSGHLPAAPA